MTSSLTNILAVILSVSVSTIPSTPSLHSLSNAWVCFSLAFSTMFQAFLSTFLIDSGYKTPIQNMDVFFASDFKLACPPRYNYICENGEETEASKVPKNHVEYLSHEVSKKWAIYHKNVSIMLSDLSAEEYSAVGGFFG